MESFIVIGHVFLALLFGLYLLVRLTVSLWGLKDKEKEQRIKAKFRKADWAFIILITITGFYPVVVLGIFDLYHLVKIILLCTIIYLSRLFDRMNYALVNLCCLVLISYIVFLSFAKNLNFSGDSTFFDETQQANVEELSQIAKGKIIFNELCVACHGIDGKLGKFQAADLSRSKLTIEEKIDIITNGSPLTVMAPYDRTLSDEEINAVAVFTEQLKDTSLTN